MRQLLVLFIFFGIFGSLNAQIYNPVKWKTDYKQVNDTEFDLIYTATIQDGWTIYSQYLESEDGPVATTINYDEGDHFSLAGKNKEDKANRKEGFDKLFDMNVVKYSKKATFTQRVKVSDLSKPITGYINYMTCDDSKCLPPTDEDFEFQLKAKSTPTTTPSTNKATTTPTTPKKATPLKVDPPKTTTPKADPPKAAPPKTSSTTSKVDKSTSTQPKKSTTFGTVGDVDVKVDINKINKSDEGLLDPVKWSGAIKKTGNNTYNIVFNANLDKGWTLYSQFTDDNGPVPTSFEFDKADHFELVGKAKEEGKKKEGPDPLFDNVNVIKFVKGPVSFTQSVKTTDASKPVTGYLTYMTCDDKRCLPPTEVDYYADLAGGKMLLGSAATKAIDAIASPSNNASSNNNSGSTATTGALAARNLSGNVIDQVRPVIRKTYQEPVGDCGEKETADGQSLLWTFVLGFLGGLVALLTPCVFPMIPLTVSYFTKGSKDRASGIRNGLIYGLSIIVIYVLIGLLITAAFGPTALNTLSTNWIANVLFFLIFVAFAFSFFGYYEITLPSSWSNKSDAMADKGGLIGTFFMAFTLALVSFSCTGPIIGSAIVASAQDVWGPFTVMLGFSTALALPFGLFAAFPAWLNSLPRSGGWMTSVKVVLGFLELALALKFLSVADMTMGWGILPYEIFMGLWVLIFGATTLYLLGFIKFPHDGPKVNFTPTRIGFIALFAGLTLYLCTGFFYNDKTKAYDSLSIMSGLAPPAHYNIFLPEPEPNKSIKERYPSFTKCANNLDCFKDYYEGLSYAKENDLPVLLDFTGHGCVNCRKTEEHIWVTDKVWNSIAEDFVLISLYVDDRKKLDEILVSKSREVKLRNVGNLWADFQIVNFEQNSQPLYVMMTPDEKVLANPRGYHEGASDYADFLECGLRTYEGISGKKKLGQR